YGIDLDKNTPEARRILDMLKRMEDEGFQFEGAEASFELLMERALGNHKTYFELDGFRVIVEEDKGNADPLAEATVRLKVKGIADTARELMARAAIDIPADYREGVRLARDREQQRLARFVLDQMLENWDIATAERRPMCADTGLPRYYVKLGNEAVVEGGLVALERALRRATADATASVPLRPNRVHPLTREDHNNNVGYHAPEVTYSVEPGGDWLDVTTVHKGGLFGTDWRMLFPGDGIPGIKRFFVDTLIESGKRGLACQPAIVGVGIGGAKDTCMRLGKEAACLRTVGSR